jgi:hypothetical protein
MFFTKAKSEFPIHLLEDATETAIRHYQFEPSEQLFLFSPI